MDVTAARAVARKVHVNQVTRFGEPLIEHVERVARGVPEEVRAVAYLHDVLEHSDLTAGRFHDHGLTRCECAALELLTRRADQSYESYISRIAHARGRAGAMARSVKLADLDDHLSHSSTGRGPDYAWAHGQITDAVQVPQPMPVDLVRQMEPATGT
jgi:hypothetical protein